MSQHVQRVLRITLEQDVILGATGATLGSLDTLDYLPGSVFLGALAGRCYGDLDSEQAWQLFHSGHVRFHDALPLTSQGQFTWPMPLSWHHFKGESVRLPSDSSRLDAERLFDPTLSPQADDGERQPKQMRKGYVSETGHWVQPELMLRMKTALDASTGRAAESQLFGYQSLKAGQQFLLLLEAGQAYEALLDQAVESLSGTVRLGRSRSAQYGQVWVELLEEPKARLVPSISSAGETLTLWLLSDLALVDDLGQPTVRPEPECLGLPEKTSWLSAKSFLRTRRYSPYNAYRRSHDEERQVICRGSVLRFRLAAPLSEAQREALSRGVGAYQVQGLGRVAVDPALLCSERPVFISREYKGGHQAASGPVAPGRVSSMVSPLIHAVERRYQRQHQVEDAGTWAREIFDKLLEALTSAREWQGIPDSQPLVNAPNRSQWGQIKEMASRYRQQPGALRAQLFHGGQAVIRERSGWELEVAPGQWLSQILREALDKVDDALMPDVVGRLAVMGLSRRWAEAVEGEAEARKAGGEG